MNIRHSDHARDEAAGDFDPQSPPVMPLHAAGGPEELPEADAFDLDGGRTHLPAINQGTLLIILVTLVAAGALYAMRATRGDLGGGSAGKAVEAKIEQALAKLTRPEALRSDDPLLTRNLARLFADTDAIIDIFAVDPAEQQVPMAELKKNPFRMLTAASPHDPDAALRQAERDRAKLKKQLTDEYQALRLQSVSGGRLPIAMIGNNMYREGDRLGSFLVRRIRTEDLAVELLAHDMLFVLRMKTGENLDALRRDVFGRGD